jgi:hypothetical protein
MYAQRPEVNPQPPAPMARAVGSAVSANLDSRIPKPVPGSPGVVPKSSRPVPLSRDRSPWFPETVVHHHHFRNVFLSNKFWG